MFSMGLIKNREEANQPDPNLMFSKLRICVRTIRGDVGTSVSTTIDQIGGDIRSVLRRRAVGAVIGSLRFLGHTIRVFLDHGEQHRGKGTLGLLG